MKYDDSGPVTIKEWKSLLLFILVVGILAGITFYYFKKSTEQSKPASPNPVRRPVDLD